MSRFPGLQFPTSNSGQPQTRAQQRPGANLLQRFFALKGDKLAKQGQDFQEDSFNSAKEAYEGSLQTYETNKAAHDASEKAKYDAAQSRYDSELGTYNAAKTQYDTQVKDYNASSKLYSDQLTAQAELNHYYRNTYSQNNPEGYSTFYDERGNPYYAKGYKDWQGNWRPSGNPIYNGSDEYRAIGGASVASIRPITAPLPGAAPAFTAVSPKFDYTTTAFGSDVPSFNYVAPESPGSANVEKWATMAGLSNQLQEVLPENARNRNRAPTSFYNIF